MNKAEGMVVSESFGATLTAGLDKIITDTEPDMGSG